MVLLAIPISRPTPALAATLTPAQARARVVTLRASVKRFEARRTEAQRALDQARAAIRLHAGALKDAVAQQQALAQAINLHAAELYMLGLGTRSFSRIRDLDLMSHGQIALLEAFRDLKRRSAAESAALGEAKLRARLARATLLASRRVLDAQTVRLAKLETFLAQFGARLSGRASRDAVRGLYCPVIGPHQVLSNYGDSRPGGPHQGDDIRADTGQRVRSILPATVVRTPSGSWVGIGIIIRDVAGNEWWYAHLSSRSVRVGQKVEAGEVIGAVGCTGRCTGSHLHFEYHPRGGNAVNPYRILSAIC